MRTTATSLACSSYQPYSVRIVKRVELVGRALLFKLLVLFDQSLLLALVDLDLVPEVIDLQFPLNEISLLP